VPTHTLFYSSDADVGRVIHGLHLCPGPGLVGGGNALLFPHVRFALVMISNVVSFRQECDSQDCCRWELPQKWWAGYHRFECLVSEFSQQTGRSQQGKQRKGGNEGEEEAILSCARECSLFLCLPAMFDGSGQKGLIATTVFD